jgi:hypothetical protein
MKIDLQAGAEMFFGVARVPLPKEIVNELTNIVKGIGAIKESYLPQVFVSGIIDEPRQMLVIVGSFDEAIIESLLSGIHDRISGNFNIDVLPFSVKDSILQKIRNSQYKIK